MTTEFLIPPETETPTHALLILDDVLPDVEDYRTATQALTFGDVEPTPGMVFHGIAPAVDDRLVRQIRSRYPGLVTQLTFMRQSPAGQAEPNFIHSDYDMSDWSGIYYLTAIPPPGDGTIFWRRRDTGAICNTGAKDTASMVAEALAWRNLELWELWARVEAVPNRLVLFPSTYYHSRALFENYGEGDTARLVQVVFGTGAFPPEGGR